MRPCKGCGSLTRALPHPGPRCASCHRTFKRDSSAKAHARRVAKLYGITAVEYDELYRAQGGRCAICRRATGKAKRLAVDHDHSCPRGHDPKMACRACVRGLCCSNCNFNVLGRLDAEALQRAYWYVVDPPARRVLSSKV